MKKSTFLSIFVLIGALMLSVTSCTKNYDDEIDAIKGRLDVLEKALKDGAVITKVTPTTAGYDLQLSNNTTIQIKNGATGFTPVIGINADGNWTVVQVKDGTPVVITGADGKPVKAVASIPTINAEGYWVINGAATTYKAVGSDGKHPYINTNAEEGVVNNWMIWSDTDNKYVDSGAAAVAEGGSVADVKIVDGFLWIGDQKTNIQNLPPIAIKEGTNSVILTVLDEEGNPKNYELPLASDVEVSFTADDIRSILVPASFESGASIYVGRIESATDVEFIKHGETKATIFKSNEITTKDRVYRLPMIVNPATADVKAENLSVIFADGKEFPIKITNVKEGYELSDSDKGPFWTKAKPAAETGLVTMEFMMKDVYTGVFNDFTNLAAKYTSADGRNLVTQYTYGINISKALPVKLLDKTVKVSIGAGFNVVEKVLVESGGFGTVSDVMFSSWELDLTDPTTNGLKGYILDNAKDGFWASTAADAVSYGNLEGKTIKIKVNTIDYNGEKASATLSVRFYVTFNGEKLEYGNLTHTLTETVADRNFVASFDPIWNRIKTERANYWSTAASNLEVTFYKKTGFSETTLTGTTAPGFTTEFKNAGGAVLNLAADYPNGYGVGSSNYSQPNSMKFIVDNAVVCPGDYVAVLTFRDNRPFANNETMETYDVLNTNEWDNDEGDSTMFKTVIRVKIENPDLTALFANVKRIPEAFWPENGGTIRAYGQVRDEDWSTWAAGAGKYTSTMAQNWDILHTGATAAAVRQRFDIKNAFNGTDAAGFASHSLSFKQLPTTPPTIYDYIPTNYNHWVIWGNTNAQKNMYVPYQVKMTCALWNNPCNTYDMDTFYIESRSEVKDGFIVKTGTQDITVQRAKQDLAGKWMGDFYKVYDCYYRPTQTIKKNNLNIFGANAKVAGVTVAAGDMDNVNKIDPRVVGPVTLTTKDNAYTGWLTITQNTTAGDERLNDWNINTTDKSSSITAPVTIPVELKFKDRYGVPVTYEFNVIINM